METKSIFLQIFGESPLLKIIDFLVVNDDFDYSMKDIAELSGVGYATLKLLWSRLEKSKMIIQTRSVGKAKMYKLNFNNPMMDSFKNFYWEITKKAVRQEAAVKVRK